MYNIDQLIKTIKTSRNDTLRTSKNLEGYSTA